MITQTIFHLLVVLNDPVAMTVKVCQFNSDFIAGEFSIKENQTRTEFVTMMYYFIMFVLSPSVPRVMTSLTIQLLPPLLQLGKYKSRVTNEGKVKEKPLCSKSHVRFMSKLPAGVSVVEFIVELHLSGWVQGNMYEEKGVIVQIDKHNQVI